MGNNSSQTLQLNDDQIPPTHLRDPRHKRMHRYGINPSIKVLPEEITSQKLRPTEQGAILQTHGTINAKKVGLVPDQVTIIPSTSPRLNNRFGSEPDVRLKGIIEDEDFLPHTIIEESPAKLRIKNRKKYKAPAPPPGYENGHPYSREFNRALSEGSTFIDPNDDMYAKPTKKHLRLFKSKQDTKSKKDINHHEIARRSMSEERYIEERTNVKGRAKSTECLSIDVSRISKFHDKRSGHVPYMLPRTISEEASTLSSAHSSKHSGGSRTREPSSIDRWIGMSTEPKNYSLPYKKEIIDKPKTDFKSLDRRLSDVRQRDQEKDFVGELHEAIKRRQSYSETKSSEPRKEQMKQFYFGMPEGTPKQKQPEKAVHKAIVHVSQSTAEYICNNNSQDPLILKEIEVVKVSSDALNRESQENPKLTRDLEKFASRVNKKLKVTKHYSSSIESQPIGDKSSSEQIFHSRHDSGSYYISQSPSSEDEENIAMSMRPTIPRKTFDLPRFSPEAAWKSISLDHLVYLMNKDKNNSHSSEEGTYSEEKIRHTSRPLPPLRSSTEKSGDSGISGDAGSPGLINEFEQLMSLKSVQNVRPLAVSSPVTTASRQALNKTHNWTPEHDLEGESMGDGSFEHSQSHSKSSQGAVTPPKLLPRAFMFSQSSANGIVNSSYDSSDSTHGRPAHFKKNKAVDSNPSSITRQRRYKGPKPEVGNDQITPTKSDDSNWLLSRSVPSLLNTGDEERFLNSLPNITQPSNKTIVPVHDDFVSLPNPHRRSLGQQNKTHIVYLPEYKARKNGEKIQSESVDRTQKGNTPFSVIHERQIWSTRSQPDLVSGMVQPRQEPKSFDPRRDFVGKKGKRFSYQSTYRQQELKKLEQKLSLEAEEKEKQRVHEMELIRQVEEEFKKKREGEKVNLRHQLRLFQLEQKSGNKKEQELHEKFVGINNPAPYYDPSSRHKNRQRLPPHMFPPELSIPNHSDKAFNISSASSPSISPASSKDNSGLLSNFTKWVKNKHSKGSVSSSTAESTASLNLTRQEPDGAPSSESKKVKENFRREIIAASKVRSGGESSPDEERRIFRQEPVNNIACDPSKVNSVLILSPETERTIKEIIPRANSPLRKNRSVPIAEPKVTHQPKLTQELSEYREERREYKDYWRMPESHRHRRQVDIQQEPLRSKSPRNKTDVRKIPIIHPEVICEIPGSQFQSPSTSSQIFCDLPKASVSDNYRRDFAQGLIHNDRCEQGVQEHDERGSNKMNRPDSAHDTIHSHGSQSVTTDSSRRSHPRPQEIDPLQGFIKTSHPKLPLNAVQPFHQTTGYRPVAFSPLGGKKLTSPVS